MLGPKRCWSKQNLGPNIFVFSGSGGGEVQKMEGPKGVLGVDMGGARKEGV